MPIKTNTLLDQVLESRNGHYCHCVEVEDVCSLESICESILDQEQANHGLDTCIDFLSSLSVYCLIDENEEEVFAFDFAEYCHSIAD